MLWHIGDVIRKRREAKGLTRRKLAIKAGVTPNTLGYLERDGANFEHDTLVKVTRALGTTEAALYQQIPGMTPAVTAPVETEPDPNAALWAAVRQLPERDQERIREIVRVFVSAAAAAKSPSGNESQGDAGVPIRPALGRIK